MMTNTLVTPSRAAGGGVEREKARDGGARVGEPKTAGARPDEDDREEEGPDVSHEEQGEEAGPQAVDPPADRESDSGDSTFRVLLRRLQEGDPGASEELLAAIYGELHRLASRQMARQMPDHTLQTTALVNEAYLKLFRGDRHGWKDRDHFLALAARAMRSVLVDHARGRNRDKRKAPGKQIPMDVLLENYGRGVPDLVELDEALKRLGEKDPVAVRIVELRFFAGLTMGEVARVLDMKLRTVERTWTHARAWLRRELS
jgi:RNA polymerase sigma-70 factor (ECF subfamily)